MFFAVGVIIFYIAHILGPMAVEIPMLLFILALVSRTAGIGVLAPMRSILRAGWIMAQIVMDFRTDIEGTADVWFWAFVVSLSWPIYSVMCHGWKIWHANACEVKDAVLEYDGVNSRRNPVNPSQRSRATTHGFGIRSEQEK